MPFTIPNEADAFHADQAEPDKVDIDILVAGYAGTGVVSGCAVTAQGSPDMTVAVAVGVIAVSGAFAAVTGGNVTITAAHATLPRIDLVVVSNAGVKSVTAGTAAAEPVMPAIPANSVVLAAVYVPATDTTIATNQIVDKRVVLGPLSYDVGTVTHAGTAGTGRPSTYGVVLWAGSVKPTNAAANDLWIHTGLDLVFKRGALAGQWGLAGGGVTGGANTVTDPSFERNDLTGEGWNTFFTGTVAASSAQARTGAYSLLVTRDTGGTENLVAWKNNNTIDNIAVVPGEQVCAAAWARPATTARDFAVAIQFVVNRSDGLLTFVEQWEGMTVTEVAGQWVQGRCTAICPSGASFARVIYKWYSVPDSEAHYLDDLTVQRGSIPSYDASVTTDQLKNWAFA